MTNCRLLLAFAVVLTPVALLPARAQPPDPEITLREDEMRRRPSTLQEIASKIVWNPRQQGVLLIVDPAHTGGKAIRQAPGSDVVDILIDDEDPSLSLPDHMDEGLRLFELEAYFDRQIVPYGDVTVLAPRTMAVLNFKNLPAPSPTLGMTESDCFRALQGLLTEAQWRKLGSPTGLGLGDLFGKQRSLFLGALPRHMAVRVQQGEQVEQLPVSAAQREAVRFHLFRRMDWFYSLGEPRSFPIFRPFHSKDTVRTIVDASIVERHPFDWDDRAQRAFGKEVVSAVATASKPGQLSFENPAFDAMIRLDKITTLGELVDRIRETTQVEIYADERYGRRAILLRGEQARARSLLKACARAVTGTYRKVGPAYVLTDDLTGLAVRQLHLHEWLQANSLLAMQAESQIHRAFDTIQPERLIGYDPDDPLLPSVAVQERYAAYAVWQRGLKADDPRRGKAGLVPVDLLPPSAQEIIAKEVGEVRRRDPGSAALVQRDRVQLTMNLHLTLDIPGVGTVPAPYAGGLADDEASPGSTPPKVHPIPASVTTRAVFLENGSAEELAPALAEAKRAGFREVWLEADLTEHRAVETLAERVRQAAQAGLKLRAVVRGGRSKTAGRDRLATNVRGETTSEYLARIQKMQPSGSRPPLTERDAARGNWLDLDAPGRTAAVVSTVQALATVPGLAGIIISDLAPPGVYPAQRRLLAPQDPGFPGLQTGYSDARRLAFLRRFHIDPIDVAFITMVPQLQAKNGPYRTLGLPRLELDFLGSEVGHDWHQFQNDRAEACLAELQHQLTPVSVPVWYYQNYRDAPDTTSFVESRDKAATPSPQPAKELTPMDDEYYTPEPLPTIAQRARSRVLLNALSVSALAWDAQDPLRDNFLNAISAQFDPEKALLKHWDGLVLDMTDESLPAAIAHLRQLPSP